MIDFKAEIKKAKAKISENKIEAIVLGPSGAGKSALGGTFPGKTLYIYGSAENHGPKSATTYGGNKVDPICIDDNRTPDEAIAALNAILDSTDFIKQYDAIVLDGATVIESIIRQTTAYKTACLTSKGVHNTFAEGPAVLSVINPILNKLRDSGKHYLVTCILDVQEMDSETGEIVESKPRLSTYAVAESVIQQFPDIFVVGPMSNGEITAHRLQFAAGIRRDSKDDTGIVKKTINFKPRLTGVKSIPNTLPADMNEVLKLKKGE